MCIFVWPLAKVLGAEWAWNISHGWGSDWTLKESTSRGKMKIKGTFYGKNNWNILHSNMRRKASCWGPWCVIQQVPCSNLVACQKQWALVSTKDVVCVRAAVACGCLLPMRFPELGPWPLCPLYLCGKYLDGRSSSPTRGSLAPLGEKAHNRRWVSKEGNTIHQLWKGKAPGNLAQGISLDNRNLTESGTGRSYDSVGMIMLSLSIQI